jgi:hypothetical protein
VVPAHTPLLIVLRGPVAMGVRFLDPAQRH